MSEVRIEQRHRAETARLLRLSRLAGLAEAIERALAIEGISQRAAGYAEGYQAKCDENAFVVAVATEHLPAPALTAEQSSAIREAHNILRDLWDKTEGDRPYQAYSMLRSLFPSAFAPVSDVARGEDRAAEQVEVGQCTRCGDCCEADDLATSGVVERLCPRCHTGKPAPVRDLKPDPAAPPVHRSDPPTPPGTSAKPWLCPICGEQNCRKTEPAPVQPAGEPRPLADLLCVTCEVCKERLAAERADWIAYAKLLETWLSHKSGPFRDQKYLDDIAALRARLGINEQGEDVR